MNPRNNLDIIEWLTKSTVLKAFYHFFWLIFSLNELLRNLPFIDWQLTLASAKEIITIFTEENWLNCETEILSFFI